MSVVVVCLNPVIQKTLKFSLLSVGEVNRAKESYWCSSGKGVNVCRVLTQLHVPNVLLTQVNGQHEKWFTEMCAKDGVHLCTVKAGGIRFCTTVLCNSEATELVEEGIPVTESSELFIEAFQKLITTHKFKIVVFTGSIAPGIPSNIFSRMTKIAKEEQCFVIGDVRGDVLTEMLKENVDLIKPNKEEFLSTFGSLEKAVDISKLATLIITDGKNKTSIYSNGVLSHVDIERVNQIVNPIGCGDSFTAGLASVLLKNEDLNMAVKEGHHCAALNLQTLTPGSLL
ncbi:Tagatose-6-phosphate kinase, putative [Entamoeba invadens IP1]|uniref:Tagatose-6-phosphate kinase, putative n=1 Tax=Entamoeba invadens IP1 TaxID=370355 RepID=UPI0002C3EE4E|nr:Tagatose-6-phosphate kinase, putative [Entamoeba invadens IP1]ELP93027.1 Tagatose-6-phosphate kinase, putative [Entamoeba invadens IP1]|eukprot:XP_004259798.1 Tagatose-6-phosphate kinase, putative [Entamoeba invadens IP1]